VATRYPTALVTGASSGVGQAMARELARRGSDLVVVARRADRLEELADELRRDAGRRVQVLPADLSRDADVDQVAARLADPAAPVDLLVNNAGDTTSVALLDGPDDRWSGMVRVNLLAVVRLTRAALPGMVRRGRGGVLSVSSLAGNQPVPGAAVYAATKAGVTQFSESVRAEVRGTGVHVTVLNLGFTWVDEGEPAGPLPRWLWLDKAKVAAEALDAVERDRATSVPGVPYRALSALVDVMPRPLVRGFTARVRPLG
jgi:short-subunit dehydrogenase